MLSSPTFEFHVSRAARDRYQFDQSLFTLTGGVVFGDVRAAREFAERMNRVRGEKPPARAGEVYAMGLIDEALHLLIALFRRRVDPKVMLDALAWFEERVGRTQLDQTLLTFAGHFPGIAVYRGELAAAQWLAGSTAGVPHRALAMEEMLMLWLANANPAFRRTASCLMTLCSPAWLIAPSAKGLVNTSRSVRAFAAARLYTMCYVPRRWPRRNLSPGSSPFCARSGAMNWPTCCAFS